MNLQSFLKLYNSFECNINDGFIFETEEILKELKEFDEIKSYNIDYIKQSNNIKEIKYTIKL